MASKKGPLSNRKKSSELGHLSDVLDKKHEALSAFQNEYATALTSADQHLKEVKVFVDRLKKMASQFEEAGSTTKRQFSLQVKQDALQAEIRLALQGKAEAHAKAGMTEAKNLLICQAFVDDILIYLAKAGLRLNPLNVMRVRKSRWA